MSAVHPRRHALTAVLAAALAAIATVALLLPATPAAAVPPAPGDTPSAVCTPREGPVPEPDLRLVSRGPSDGGPSDGGAARITRYAFDSAAVGREVAVNVLLPQRTVPGARYPVLYLLHGGSGSHRDWQAAGDVVDIVDQAVAAGQDPFIVVMPDAGAFGFYSDWFGSDVDGHNPGPPPAWTTHHIRELIPWVDATLPTIPNRDGRAIAGLSMGGFGAMSYATRFPDLFTAAASFSGAVDPSIVGAVGSTGITAVSPAFNGAAGIDQCIWGESTLQQVRWRAANPTHLVGNLRGTGMRLYVASGGAGPANNPAGLAETDPVEEAVYLMSRNLARHLADRDVPVTTDFYGTGGHEWVWWQRGLREFLPMMGAAFADPAPAPQAFDHLTAQPSTQVWGWTFDVDRDVTEFLELSGVSPRGLTAVGSGLLSVTTARAYQPSSRHRVAVDGGPGEVVRADADGRLRFTVDLGPAHRTQQVRFDDAATATWTRAEVRISPVRGRAGR